ncbi:helix-turn-helix domain-containing protein [Planctomicrobium piriforme]|uniref:HTH-type transcriptional regulator / antitoxin HigA n=1 Tax=Planctomicrobium piriforme TaxID=1576369 RepID=A0A1I3FWQ6_9PLAN|nr:helix-turn-helix domain-containing protein [Planctomicrobium piriforme]SFI15512.1 HTH-type transcriptional regulator / antitoxin HigA [Planctomicrobium piriforme]
MSDKPQSPGERIRQLLKDREWTQAELGAVLGLPGSRVTELVQNKKVIDPELAIKLSEAFISTTPREWMELDAEYRLSLVSKGDGAVRRRASMLELAPVREMESRGWIQKTSTPEELEVELRRFFDTDTLDPPPSLFAATRKTDSIDDLTPIQRAWCFQVRRIAKNQLVTPYSEDRMPECIKALRKLAAFPQEARKVSNVLSEYGIRFVIVAPIASCKIDGVAMWLDDTSPVIGMSVRFDRIDSFWFTLFHELSHIQHRDALSVDDNLVGAEAFAIERPAIEQRANKEASKMLIETEVLDSFIKRVSPLYSKDRINQFARKVQIHPGIVVGQLQHRAEIGFHANKEMLVKVRDIVVATSVTDGWGQIIG